MSAKSNKGDNLVPYGTVKILATSKEMVAHCKKADACLSEVLKYLPDDTLLDPKQKANVQRSAVKLRDALLFSIKMFTEVRTLWQTSLSSTTKAPARRPSKGKGSKGENA